MRVDADSGGNGEVARGGLAMEILELDAAERNAANVNFVLAVARDRGLRGGAGAKRNFQVVGKRVGGAKGRIASATGVPAKP